jgi:hypothetical protein
MHSSFISANQSPKYQPIIQILPASNIEKRVLDKLQTSNEESILVRQCEAVSFWE